MIVDTVWFDGPPGAGKTTFIERLLLSTRDRSLGVLRARVAGSVEDDSAQDPDVARYVAAGVVTCSAVRCPPNLVLDQVDRACRRLLGASGNDAVLVEGQLRSARSHENMGVCVLRPLPEGVPLMFQAEKESMRITLGDYLSMVCGGGEVVEEPPPDDGETEEEIVEDIELPADVAAQLEEWAENGVPILSRGWMTQPGHESVVLASVFVINIHSEAERPAALRLSDEIRRLRADPSILGDFPRSADASRRISVFIANLRDGRDPELKKALARIKRNLGRSYADDWF